MDFAIHYRLNSHQHFDEQVKESKKKIPKTMSKNKKNTQNDYFIGEKK